MAASGLGSAIIPGMLGVLARRLSLEFIPIFLAATFITLLALYRLSMTAPQRTEIAGAS